MPQQADGAYRRSRGRPEKRNNYTAFIRPCQLFYAFFPHDRVYFFTGVYSFSRPVSLPSAFWRVIRLRNSVGVIPLYL